MTETECVYCAVGIEYLQFMQPICTYQTAQCTN